MKNILLVSYSFIAALIGAGFASGQEVLCYFVRFGKYGLWGMLLCVLITAVFIFTLLRVCIAKQIYCYNYFTSTFFHLYTKKLIFITMLAISFASFSAMLSALTELAKIYNLPSLNGLIPAVIGFILITQHSDRILRLNGFLGIIITIAVITCCCYMLKWREYHTLSSTALASSHGAIYAGYNLIAATPILVLMSKKLKSSFDALAVSLITSTAMLIMMCLIFGMLSMYVNRIPLGELPMLTLALRQGKVFGGIYAFVLLFSTITTLAASAISCSELLNLQGKKLKTAYFISIAYLFSSTGFSGIVATGYGICGIIGIICCFITIKSCIFTN